MLFKKCKVVMLATKEKSPIFLIGNWRKLYTGTDVDIKDFDKDESYQHLYITSDEKIKDGDWCIMFDSFGHMFSDHIQQYLPNKGHVLNDGLHKIIATINTSLKLYGEPTINGNRTFKGLMPQPSPQFIEKYIEEYNKGTVITEVMVEYLDNSDYNPSMLADIRLKVNSKDNTITINKVKDFWNKDEVKQLCIRAFFANSNGFSIDKWIDANI